MTLRIYLQEGLELNYNKYLLLLVFVLLGFASCEDKQKSTDMFSSGKTEQTKQTIFTLRTVLGEEIQIELINPHQIKMLTPKYQNKVILLDFWATWCPPCIEEIPHLIKVREKYKDKMEIIGVLAEANKPIKELDAFVAEYKVTYPITTTHESDDNMRLFEELTNLRTLPFKSMYDANGTYITHYYGAVLEELLVDTLEKVLP